MRIQRRISLPLELDDHIIDQLDREEDVKTILNCALVSRIWLPATRRKLYRHVAIRSREQWERFNSTLGSLGNTLEEGVQKYLKQAHTLVIGPLTGKEYCSWAPFVFTTCAQFMPNIKHIKLSQLYWESPEDFIHGGHYYPSLTTLELRSCSFPKLYDMHLLASGFTELVRLYVHVDTGDYSWGDFLHSIEPQPLPVIPGASQLEFLEVRCYTEHLRAVEEWLLHAEWPVLHLNKFIWKQIDDNMYTKSTDEDVEIAKIYSDEILPLISKHSLESLQCMLAWIPGMFVNFIGYSTTNSSSS